MPVTIAQPYATNIAIAFVVVTFFLLILLLVTWTICCCWKYKLHKRKQELKSRDLEQGIYTMKPKGCNCCGCGMRCCGCWSYTCRSCQCCCVHPSTATQDIVVPATAMIGPTTGQIGGGQYGWSKDVYVYNTGAGGGGCSNKATPCSSQPVNFNNRWSSCSDGRLNLNGGGMVSRITPGAQTCGGIYPSMPVGYSNGDQFQLRMGK